MRLISVQCPAGSGKQVLEMAFSVGVAQASILQVQLHRADEEGQAYEKIEIETSTPIAKRLVEQLLKAPFYERATFTVSIRGIRSLISSREIKDEAWPIAAPTTDVLYQLWQFSHITFSHMARTFIAALLLAYGMIKLNIPVMVAGLLFLPLTNQMLSIGLGVMTRDWKLLRQGALNLLLTCSLVALAGLVSSLFMEPPLLYQEFGTLKTSFAFALIIGIAASLASADDAGIRELIGLAAASQVSLVPAWVGISVIYGFPEQSVVLERLGAFLVTITTLSLSASVTYMALRFRRLFASAGTRIRCMPWSARMFWDIL